MSRLKQKRKSVFRWKWCMICISISSSLVIAATSIVFLMFQETTMQQISRQVSHQLEQISGVYDRIETQAYQMHKEMLRDKDILTFLKSGQVDRVKEFYASTELKTILASYDSIDYVGVYSGNLNRYVGTDYVGRFQKVLGDDDIGWRYEEGGLVITLKEKHGFLHMGVYQDTLKKMLDRIITGEDITLIFKETGECLLNNREGEEFSLDQLNGEEAYQRLFIKGKRYLVTQYRDEGRGLIYFRLLPTSVIMKETGRLQRNIVCGALLTIAVGWFIYLKAGKAMYQPLDQLIERLETEDPEDISIINDLNYLIEQYDKKHIENEGMGEKIKQKNRLLIQISIEKVILKEFEKEEFCRLLESVEWEQVYQLCHIRMKKAHSEKRKGKVFPMLEVAAEELLYTFDYKCFEVKHSGYFVLITIPDKSQAAGEELFHLLTEQLKKECGCPVFSCTTRIVASSEELYTQLCDLTIEMERLIYTEGCLLQGTETSQELLWLLKEADKLKREKEEMPWTEFVNCIYHSLLQHPPGQGREISAKILNKLTNGMDLTGFPVDYAKETIRTAETAGEIKNVFEELCTYLLERTSENRHQEAFERVRAYVEQHYMEENLSLELLSDYVGLSSVYFNRLFKESTGKSIQEYIISVRLGQAVLLLSEEKLSLEQISRRVGIPNVNYFYTLFKKSYGVTPGQYRKNLKLEKME